MNADTVAKIKARPEVKDALPRMTLQFPATGYGKFEGQGINFEVGGFTDGIPDAHVAGDPKLKPVFKDWEPNGRPRPGMLHAQDAQQLPRQGVAVLRRQRQHVFPTTRCR